MSARELLESATARLTAAGIDSPRVDAELLLAHVLQVGRTQVLTMGPLDDDRARAFTAVVERRARREPLQHITGEAPFRFALLAVGPGVFIPRPETELLIDAVLPHLRAVAEPVAVDLCAGSGALALALAQEVPGATVIALERAESARSWLRRNVAGTEIEIVAADVAHVDVLADWTGRVDAVVSNPPYVPTTTAIAAEVERDPAEAVFAGADGLDVIPAVITLAARLLRPGGLLAIEHDESHETVVPELLRATPEWTDVAGHRDLTGRARYATAVRARPPGKMAP